MFSDFDQGAGDGVAMRSSPARTAAPPAGSAASSAVIMTGGLVTMVTVLLIFVLLALALVFLQFYFGDRARTPPSGRGRAGGNKGVDPELLKSLPVTVYRRAKDDDSAAEECAVCLAELEDGEEERFLPRCGHGFHAECVDLWLASHSTCPLCRLTVAKPDAPPATALTALPPEPANYTAALPASVLLGVSDDGRITSDDGGTGPSAMLAIDIPEALLPTPRGAAKSPGSASARLRSLSRLWSFGRQGTSSASTPSCSCRGVREIVDIEQGTGVFVGTRAVEAPPETALGATPRDTA